VGPATPRRGPHRLDFRRHRPSPDHELSELIATKLRALYQRRMGRDLFDLWIALQLKRVDPTRIVRAFHRDMVAEGHHVNCSESEKNLAARSSRSLSPFGESVDRATRLRIYPAGRDDQRDNPPGSILPSARGLGQGARVPHIRVWKLSIRT
jgi:hypothetical protein